MCRWYNRASLDTGPLVCMDGRIDRQLLRFPEGGRTISSERALTRTVGKLAGNERKMDADGLIYFSVLFVSCQLLLTKEVPKICYY